MELKKISNNLKKIEYLIEINYPEEDKEEFKDLMKKYSSLFNDNTNLCKILCDQFTSMFLNNPPLFSDNKSIGINNLIGFIRAQINYNNHLNFDSDTYLNDFNDFLLIIQHYEIGRLQNLDTEVSDSSIINMLWDMYINYDHIKIVDGDFMGAFMAAFYMNLETIMGSFNIEQYDIETIRDKAHQLCQNFIDNTQVLDHIYLNGIPRVRENEYVRKIFFNALCDVIKNGFKPPQKIIK